MTFLCYVAFDDVADYLAKGWLVRSLLGGNNGHYAVLMIWEGEGDPP